jgi:hypothetical protein
MSAVKKFVGDSFIENFSSTEERLWAASWVVLFVVFLCAT